MGLMMLAAGPGVTITISATGKEAAAAVDALCSLIAEPLRRRGLGLLASPRQRGESGIIYIKKSLYMRCGPGTGLI